jgi:hypothetical protein
MTWSERIAHINDFFDPDYLAEGVPRFVAQRLAAHQAGTWGAADQVGYLAAQLLLTRGPAFARETFAPIRHVLPQAVAAYLAECDLDAGDLAMMILDMSDATNAFELIGFDVPPSVLESFRPYLPAVKEFREYPEWRWRKGFTALALDERLVWAPIAGYLPERPIPFTPGETFEFNVQGLLAHLGAARLAGARFEDVAPAWRSFMACADSLINTHQIEYVLVLWVARIVYHHIGQHPPGIVGDLLHAEIQRCIAEGV